MDKEKMYYMYEMYKEKVKELMKEKAEIDESLMKARIALDAVRELKGRKGGESMFVPVGSSVFIPASLKEGKVLVGISRDIAIEVLPEKAEEILLERMKRMEKASRDYNQLIIDLRKEMDKIAEEIIKSEEP